MALGFVLASLVVAVALAVLEPSGEVPGRRFSGGWRKLLPAGSVFVASGSDGGTVWEVRIPNSFVHTARTSYVYLPRYGSAARYPVVYLLHGFPGSPSTFVREARIVTVADDLIRSGMLRPAIVVMPVAGETYRYDGEWAGPWEQYLIHDVLPWTQTHLPTIDAQAARAIGGLSAGGFGAVDIAFRHPGLFGTIEAWAGYFHPLRDGSFAHATRAQLLANDPAFIVHRLAAFLRRTGVRLFVAAGRQNPVDATRARDFSLELSNLHVQNSLVLRPGGHHDSFWRRILPLGLAYTFPIYIRPSRARLQP